MPRFDEMQEVIKKYVANENPTKIAKDLNLRRVDVLDYIDEWRKTTVGSDIMRERVETLISATDEHYSQLIRKAYEIIEEVDRLASSDKETMTRSQMLSQKKGALDLIAKLEKDRIDILQKAGLLEAADFGDQLAAFEEEKEVIKDIVENHLCDVCKPKFTVALANRNKKGPEIFGQ